MYRKRECTSQLVYRMCEEHAVDRLTTYNFARLSDEVEDALSFKVRNADPRIRPFYSRILYTWYITRGDYRNGQLPDRPSPMSIIDTILRLLAALTMYQRARKLANVIGSNPDQFISLAEQQLEAFVVSINALSLIDPKSAWFVLPLSAETGNEVSACSSGLECRGRPASLSRAKDGSYPNISRSPSMLRANATPKSLNCPTYRKRRPSSVPSWS